MSWLGTTLEVLKYGGSAAAGYALKFGIEKAKGNRPAVFHVDQDVSRIYGNVPNWVSFPYFFGCDREYLPENPPARPLDWWAWAMENHAMPAQSAEIQVVVSTRVDRPLLVNNLRVELASVDPAPTGSIVICPVGGADITLRQVAVTLDEFCPEVRFLEAGAAKVENLAFSLKKDEIAKFSITTYVDPHSENCNRLFRWRGLLDIVIGHKLRTVRIDDAGRPFVLHGGGNTRSYCWLDGRWQ